MEALLVASFVVFFFSSRRRHTRFDCDWSSDVCSSDLRRFGVAEDTEYTTLVVEMIVGEGELLIHFVVNVRSSKWAEVSQSVSMELSITARPLCRRRNDPPRVTWPIGCTATPYCLAVWRTRASEEGLADTTARAPRSPKAANSAEPASSNFTCTPTGGATCCPPTVEE